MSEEAASGPEEVNPERRVQELEAEVQRIHSTLEEREQELSSLREQVDSAATRYRAVLLASAPEVPEELVQGKTIDELDTSLASARIIVEKIAQKLESQEPSDRVPAGAPPRRPPDLSALSPQEKILYGLQRG